MIKLSIIIVSFNTKSILRDCLNSIFANAPKYEYEVIIVDNNSHDGSVEMVKNEFAKVKVVENHDNRGFAAANNQGFEVANGEYYLLLNSDTIVLGDVLSKSVEYMDSNSDTGMMGCRVLNSDMTTQETCFMWPSLLNIAILSSGLGGLFPESKFIKRERMHGWNRDTEREVDAITGCYILVRSEAISKIGMLDEDFFFYGEETDWCRRFKTGGYRVVFSPVGEIIHLGGASGNAIHYTRKLMLSQALVRLQRKHNGVFCAIIAWLLLLGECVIKSIGFGSGVLLKGKRYLPAFKKHFWALIKFGKAWAAKSSDKRKVVLAVASSGGHWMQLRRLERVFDRYRTIYVSTKSDYREGVIGYPFITVKDVNRWKKPQIPYACLQMLYTVISIKPDVVISTGALPGLLAILFGRLIGAKCIWVDSIANSEELSMSGRVAGKFAHLWLTQWEHLSCKGSDKSKPEYAGKVL